MPVNIHGKQYVTVTERLIEAREAIKSINTEVIPNGGAVVIKATVVTDKGTFTGISAANPNKAIEKQSPYEVAETSAVGRALGFAGYGAIESVASADEMVKAGATNTTQPELNEEVEEEFKICSTHEEQMTKGHSASKNKDYWYHRNAEKQICFGGGYKE